jgi:pyrroloquinoline quinone (PQQ) biosynthesis protein C
LFQSMHPFWRDCFRGRLEIADIRRWALDVYLVVRDFSWLYVQVASKCEAESTLTFLAETIFEETGSGVEAESHPTLFRGFLKALGVPENEIRESSETKAGRDILDHSWRMARHGSFLEGLTCLGLGIERPLPAFFQMIARSFQKHFGLEASALKFFEIHTIADVKHSQVAARIVSELAQTREQQARVREVLIELWDLQKRQLDELHQRCRHIQPRAIFVEAGARESPAPEEAASLK